jgi:Ca2+-binding RTX toxin-like protein
VNRVRGSEFNDIITGNASNNTLEGQGGNDVLNGGAGDLASDTLTGGTGSDIFIYARDDANDVITDFHHAEADRIDLRSFATIHSISDLIFTTLTVNGDPNSTRITSSVANAFDSAANDRILLQGVNSATLQASDFIFNVTGGSSVSVTVQTPDGYDFGTLYDDLAASNPIQAANDSTHVFAVDSARGITFEMIGTGFTYSGGLVNGGTITEIDILDTTDPTATTQDHVLVNTNGWNINAAAFFSDIGSYAANHTGPGLALLNGIFNNATYNIVGSAGAGGTNTGSQDGADVFFGGDHADAFNGMPGPFGPGDNGSDTVDYSHAAAGITVDLSNPLNNTGAATGDTYISIENIRGTNFNDVLTGDANNNVLEGGLGTNTLNGGGGFDVASYEHATAGVTVSLIAPGSQPTGGAGTDTLTNIEGLRGSNFNDTLIGNGSSVLEGGAGNDQLIGQSGQGDTASYEHATAGVSVNLAITVQQDTHGAGLDTLTNIANLSGSHFNDTLTGDAHDNVLFGNGDHDTFVFNKTAPGGIGHDTIGDFVSGQDNIKLDYLAFTPGDANSFSTWLSGHVTTVNSGSDLLIDLDLNGANTILLKNASVAGLHASDFILPA